LCCKMEVLLQIDPEEEERAGFRELIRLCNKEDQTDYAEDLDYDFFYSIRNEEKKESGLAEDFLALLMGYRLGTEGDGQSILLCSVFIHPFMRGQGLFTACIESLLDDFRSMQIRIERKGKESSFLHYPYLYSEYFMEKRLAKPISFPGDRKEYPFGEVYFSPYNEKTLYLYGLMVENRFRGQGKGEEILRDALEKEERGPFEKVILQVDSRNLPAMRLYTGLGFYVKDSLSYYRIEREKRNGKNL